jgi:hypothetical protein
MKNRAGCDSPESVPERGVVRQTKRPRRAGTDGPEPSDAGFQRGGR